MLSDLVVEGLGVIESAELSLEGGSAALTGETGAGKTLVVAAAQLLLGDRADRTLVRSGSGEARVEGRFLLPAGHQAHALLEENGLAAGPGGEIVIGRTVSDDGRSKARINGRLVTLTMLSEVGATLMEIAGQHEHQRVGRAEVQRSLLDGFAGEAAHEAGAAVASAVRSARSAERRLEELRSSERSRSREIDVLNYEIKEITAAAVSPGETEDLVSVARRLEHAEEIAGGVAGAIEALRGEGGAEEAIGSAERAVQRLEAADPQLGSLAVRLEAARYEVADVAAELAERLTPADPDALETVRERLAILSRLKRKYGATDEDVLAYLEDAETKLAGLSGADEDLARLEDEHARSLEAAREAAVRLSELRRLAAPKLAAEVEARLRDLALPEVTFSVELEERPLFEGGLEDISFMVSPNPGELPKPVAKTASGGELSRIALALSLVTTAGGVSTMIFDEVDAGVGGEAARSVGAALQQLSREQGIQVVVVTHLPQVAAFADQHLRVAKQTKGGRTVASVTRIEGAERETELARMLAGSPDSSVAHEHAKELLSTAATSTGPSSR
jgi:DNA repair protein RecN (Recombination protein N)